MRANEIFVGAYVIALGMVRKIKTIVKKDTGVEVSFEGKNPVIVSLDMLCPIPLSIEILEKNFNGAVENRYGLTCINYDLNKNSFIQAFAGGFYLCACVDDSKHHFHDEICIKELESVHQLQQFLTICGIEREITLDGISVKEG